MKINQNTLKEMGENRNISSYSEIKNKKFPLTDIQTLISVENLRVQLQISATKKDSSFSLLTLLAKE
uniref:Putative ovule protein n=1 Tax=Solanum chacoense TaxID=4108 RepID=A0A0V0GLC7_SOLCH